MRVKICGITNDEDVMKASVHGAWAVGFIFVKKSPRYISPSRARKLIETFEEQPVLLVSGRAGYRLASKGLTN